MPSKSNRSGPSSVSKGTRGTGSGPYSVGKSNPPHGTFYTVGKGGGSGGSGPRSVGKSRASGSGPYFSGSGIGGTSFSHTGKNSGAVGRPTGGGSMEEWRESRIRPKQGTPLRIEGTHTGKKA